MKKTYRVEMEFAYGWDDAGWNDDGVLLRFDSREEAEREIDDFFASLPEYMRPHYSRDQFRVAEAPTKKKFLFVAETEFYAEDIEHAFEMIADHFRALQEPDGNWAPLDHVGMIHVEAEAEGRELSRQYTALSTGDRVAVLRALRPDVSDAECEVGGTMSKRGWDLFDRDGTGILELRRVDEDDVFENDDHAWRHFIYRLVYETDPKCARAAAELLNNWRPIMTDGMR